MIDILYLAHNRLEFTRESLKQLERNTDWNQVGNLHLFADTGGITDGTDGLLDEFRPADVNVHRWRGPFGGPVNIMGAYLARFGDVDHVFAKIDNDVIVPPNWLRDGIQVMEWNPDLSFLGIEPPASRTRAPWTSKRIPAPENFIGNFEEAGYAPCQSIGGVGFMRAEAFRGRSPMKQHSTYGGFTDWQHHHVDLVKGWIAPPMRLFLLDRLPFEPWASLSKVYIRAGWQRPWTNYEMDSADQLWSWWLEDKKERSDEDERSADN